MIQKPLLLFNEREAVGGIVRVGTPCTIQIQGMMKGDTVIVDAMDSDRNVVYSRTTMNGDRNFVFEEGELFQATRTKSVGSRVSVFASTK